VMFLTQMVAKILYATFHVNNAVYLRPGPSRMLTHCKSNLRYYTYSNPNHSIRPIRMIDVRDIKHNNSYFSLKKESPDHPENLLTTKHFFVLFIYVYFLISYNNQQKHNYLTHYHTPTRLDTVVSPSDSL
jgi:hypothetical protein